MKYWRQFLGTLAGLALIYPLVLYCGQRHLYLFPDRFYLSPTDKGLPQFTEKPFTSPDGLKIMGWYAKGDINKPALLFFHGNSGQIAKFAPFMKTYIDKGYTVYMSEYRGFGGTLGEFTQQTLYQDAIAAFDFLHHKLGHSDIIVYGYSMGTAAAAATAANRPARGLILAAPFYSLKKVVSDQPVPFGASVLAYELPSYRFIRAYNGPLLIIHGTNDTLIAPKHGNDLYDLSPAADKQLVLIPKQSHNALFFGDKAHPLVAEWLERQCESI